MGAVTPRSSIRMKVLQKKKIKLLLLLTASSQPCVTNMAAKELSLIAYNGAYSSRALATTFAPKFRNPRATRCSSV